MLFGSVKAELEKGSRKLKMAHGRGVNNPKQKGKHHFIDRLHLLERIMVARWCVRACVPARHHGSLRI